MVNYKSARYVAVLAVLAGPIGCGAASENLRKAHPNGDPSAPAAVDPATPVDPNAAVGPAPGTNPAAPGISLTSLDVLAPADLARKIYDMFGPKMTIYNAGKGDMDYLDANSNSFTGSISTDPNNKIANKATTGYFLALAGLAGVVGNNYSTQLFSKTALVDCTVEADATKIAQVVAASATPDELKGIVTNLVNACKVKPGDAVKALIQSLSFAVKQ